MLRDVGHYLYFHSSVFQTMYNIGRDLFSEFNVFTVIFLVEAVFFILVGCWMARKGRLISLAVGLGLVILGLLYCEVRNMLVEMLGIFMIVFGLPVVLGTLLGTLIAFCVGKLRAPKASGQ